MPERGLGNGAAVIIVVPSMIILILAAFGTSYWQGLLINIGTGGLLFVAPTARDPSSHVNQMGDIHQRSNWRAAGPLDD